MRYWFFFVFLLLLVLVSQIVFAQEDSLLPLQGIAKKNNVKLSSGDIIVEIYDAPTGGNLIYNSTTDFSNVISGGEYDIILGNGSRPLSLNYGQRYYMEMYLNGVDMDFNGSERKVFMSNVGNISMTTPLRTNSTDSDDALNISLGGAFIGGNTVFNNFFNVTTTTSAVRTNGTVTILSLLSPALSINGFNVSGSNAALSTNGTVSIVSLASPALSIRGFNVSGSNAALSTNGTVTILSRASPALSINGFNVSGENSMLSTNGTMLINNINLPIANITGGLVVEGDFIVSGAPDFVIGDTGDITSNLRLTNEDKDDTLNITSGGGMFISGNAVFNNFFNVTTTASAVRTNGTVTILSTRSEAFLLNGFNISGATTALRTNGTVTINNTDVDDALNITGGTFMTGNLSVGLRDTTTAGIFINEQGSIVVGNASSTNKPHVEIFDGGTDNCASIKLYDETGAPYYLFVASTGQLMIKTGEPSTCANTDGTVVGVQT